VPDFDAYHKWLGIPPKDQPPNHDRLLAIDLFESDPDVIRDAAEQRMAHVRNYQLGQHMALSQQILNELATARVCLLNPEKKAAYDQQLQAKLAPAAESPVVDSVADLRTAHVHCLRGLWRTNSWGLWGLVGGLVAVVVLMLVIAGSFGKQEIGRPSGQLASPLPPPAPQEDEGPASVPGNGKEPAVYNVEIDPPHATLTVRDNNGIITGSGKQRQIRIDDPKSSGKVVIEAFCVGYKSSEQWRTPVAGKIVDLQIQLEKLPETLSPLKERLRGTKWTNTPGATFEWDETGTFRRRGVPFEYTVVDDTQIRIVFGEKHIDTLVFDKDLTRFEQFSTKHPKKKPLFTGERVR
jgi:hypothetical protein